MRWPEKTFCRGIGELVRVSFIRSFESVTRCRHDHKPKYNYFARILHFKSHLYLKKNAKSTQQHTISANLDDVREEWEKVKLSYEILIDRKTRLKYDRNSVVADPGAAVGRAVGGAMGSVFTWGVESVFRMVAGEKGNADSVDGNAAAGGGSRDMLETSK